jgi:hypothetical protein
MKYSFMFRDLGTVDLNLIKALQDYALSLEYVKGVFNPFVILQAQVDPLQPEVQELTRQPSLAFFNPGRLVGAEVDKMLPHAYLREHSDTVAYATGTEDNIKLFHKIHVPLLTPQGCSLMWRNTPTALIPKVGHVYLINNVDVHSAVNLSNEPRYHLILKYKNTTQVL